MREVAMSSIAPVIFLIDWTERVRRRSTLSCAAISASRSLLRGRLVDLDGLLVHLVGVHRLRVLLVAGHRGPIGGGELLLERLHRLHHAVLGALVERPGVTDLRQDALLVVPDVVEEL